MNETEPRRRRRGIPWVVLLFILVAGGAVAGWTYHARFAKPSVTYDTEALEKGDVESHVSATGTVNAIIALEVGSQVSGTVTRLYVDYNSPVKRGQALAQIDPKTFEAQVQQSVASVNNAQAQLGNSVAAEKDMAANIQSARAALEGYNAKYASALASVANNRAALRTAQANLRKAQFDYQTAEINNNRNKALLAKDLIAHSDFDTTNNTFLDDRAAVAAARGQVQAAEAQLKSAEYNARSAAMDIEGARLKVASSIAQHDESLATMRANEAQVRVQQANLESARTTLSYTILRSPIDGIVVDRKVQVGQTVAASFQAPDLFSLAQDLSTMEVDTSVDESDIGRVRVGAKAEFTVDAFPNHTFHGSVYQIRQAPVTTNNVVTYTVIVRTDNRRLLLKPGMTATITIDVEKREDVLLLPNSALRFKPVNVAAEVEKTEKKSASSEASGNPSGSPSGRHRHGDSEGGHHWNGDGQGGGHRWADGDNSGGSGGHHWHHDDSDDSGKGRHGDDETSTRIDTTVSNKPQRVYTVDPNDATKLIVHRVRLGITDGENTEIVRSDLKEGDKIVTGSSNQGSSSEGGSSGKGGGGRRGGGMRLF